MLVSEACNHNRITTACNDIGMVQVGARTEGRELRPWANVRVALMSASATRPPLLFADPQEAGGGAGREEAGD